MLKVQIIESASTDRPIAGSSALVVNWVNVTDEKTRLIASFLVYETYSQNRKLTSEWVCAWVEFYVPFDT